jgi:hypothetical protein
LTFDDALSAESTDSNVANELILLFPQGAPSSEAIQPKSSHQESRLETTRPLPTEDPLLKSAHHRLSPHKTAEIVRQEQTEGASKAPSAAMSSSVLGVTAETKAVIPQQRSNGDAECDAGERASSEAIPVRPVAGPPQVVKSILESGAHSIGQVASSEQPFVAASDIELTIGRKDGVVKSGLESTPALATPPGVAGVFFRPKRVAWVRGAEAESSLGREQSTKVPVPLARSTAAGDISPCLEAEQGRLVSALEVEPLKSPPKANPVLNPRGEAHSPVKSSPPKTDVPTDVDALTPSSALPSSPPSDAATVGTVNPTADVPVSNTPPPSVEREGGMPAAIDSEGGVTAVPENVKSPPLATAASMFSSPASKNRALLEAPSSHGRLGTKSPFLGLQNAASPPRTDAPPAAQEAEDAPEAVETPVVPRPLFSASSFFSPRAASRAAVEDTKTTPKPSPSAQTPQAPGSAALEPEPFPEPSPTTQTPSKLQPRATSPPAIYTTGPTNPQEEGGFGDKLPAEPGRDLPGEPLAPLSPSSPRLGSASSFFSPQAKKKPVLQSAARSLFSTREPAEAVVSEALVIDEVSGEENEQVNGNDNAEVIVVPNAEVIESPKRVDSPPPRAAACFFSPRKVGTQRLGAEQLKGLSRRFGSGLRERFENGYPMQTQENESAASNPSVGVEVSAVTSSLEANPSDQSGGSFDEVRPVSPAPPSAAGFFSPSKRSLSGAFKRAEVSKFPTDASHGDLVLDSDLLRTEQSTVFAYNQDQGGEATPYASANCSPMSVTGSSPRYGGVVPSRRVWEVLGEDMARHVEASHAVDENVKFEQIEVGDGANGVAEEPLSGQQDAATWQLGTTAVVDVPDALVGAGQEKRTELGSCHVLDWESPDHQKVRTPPYRSGVGALTQRKVEGGVAGFPSLTGGARMEKDEEDKNGVGLTSVKQNEEPMEAETEQDSALCSPNGRVEIEAGPIPKSQSDLPSESRHNRSESPAKRPLDTPPMQRATDIGAPNQVAVLGGDSSAQFGGERWTAVGTEQASPSPSKHGLWSTLLGGLRGMVTPPKVTAPKLTVAKSAGKPGDIKNRADIVVPGGTFRPRWASPLKDAQGERTPPVEKKGVQAWEIGPMADSALEEAAHSRLVTLLWSLTVWRKRAFDSRLCEIPEVQA